jgi:hypothetical protein
VPAWPKKLDLYVAPAVYGVIRRGSWDVVHFHGYNAFVVPIGLLAAVRRETPLIAAVPEPATWPMMILGFGRIGLPHIPSEKQTRSFVVITSETIQSRVRCEMNDAAAFLIGAVAPAASFSLGDGRFDCKRRLRNRG